MIGFDIDGVLMDFNLHIYNTVKRKTGYELPYPFTKFYKEFPGCSQREFKQIIVEAINTIEETTPIEDSIDTIKNIYELVNDKIVFITSRPESKKYDTLQSLNFHIQEKFDFEVIITDKCFDKKKAIETRKNIKFFVEDNINHMMNVSPCLKTGFLMNYPWNRNVIMPYNIIRVDNLKEVYNYLKMNYNI